MSAGPADKALDTFKILIWDVYVEVAIAALVAAVPLTGFFAPLAGALAKILGIVIRYVTDKLYELLSQGVNFGTIILLNKSHHANFVKASDQLRSSFDKNGMDSPEFKKDRDEHKAALLKFVRYGAAA